MSSLRAGRISVGADSPRVVGTITTRACLDRFGLEPASCDFAEVRLDQIGIFPGWAAACRAIQTGGTPVLLTLRSTEEGGKSSLPPDERAQVLRSGLADVSLVDVEWKSGLAERLREECRRSGRLLISSFHDFAGTPPAPELESIYAAAAVHADIVKIATFVKEESDLTTLRSFLQQPRPTALCLIGMGELGRSTRISFPKMGSCLTYGYLDSPAAPGQFSAAELMRQLRSAQVGAA